MLYAINSMKVGGGFPRESPYTAGHPLLDHCVSKPFPENEPQWHLKFSVLHVYLSNMHGHACLTLANSSRG